MFCAVWELKRGEKCLVAPELTRLNRRMAQFWHTFVAYSQNVTMTNLDMATWSTSGQSSVNTDGTNTWNSKDITISNWTVKCGDVCCPLQRTTNDRTAC